MKRLAGLTPVVVKLGLAAASWQEILRELVRELRLAGALTEEAEPYRRLVEREETASTALGGGIALPHARTLSSPDARLAVARLAPPVDFNAPDSIPVDLVFLLVGPPEAPGEHVRLLAAIAKLAQRSWALADLRGARDVREFRAVLDREL